MQLNYHIFLKKLFIFNYPHTQSKFPLIRAHQIHRAMKINQTEKSLSPTNTRSKVKEGGQKITKRRRRRRQLRRDFGLTILKNYQFAFFKIITKFLLLFLTYKI